MLLNVLGESIHVLCRMTISRASVSSVIVVLLSLFVHSYRKCLCSTTAIELDTFQSWLNAAIIIVLLSVVVTYECVCAPPIFDHRYASMVGHLVKDNKDTQEALISVKRA